MGSLDQISSQLRDNKLDCVVNVAGGFMMGNASCTQLLADARLALEQSIASSLLAARILNKHGNKGGLLVLPGAAAATSPTPTLLAYGLAKAATHHLTQSLAAP